MHESLNLLHKREILLCSEIFKLMKETCYFEPKLCLQPKYFHVSHVNRVGFIDIAQACFRLTLAKPKNWPKLVKLPKKLKYVKKFRNLNFAKEYIKYGLKVLIFPF